MVIIGDPSTVTTYGKRCLCARYKVGTLKTGERTNCFYREGYKAIDTAGQNVSVFGVKEETIFS